MYFVGLILLLFKTTLASPGMLPPAGQTLISISDLDDRRRQDPLDPSQDLQLAKNLLTITGTGTLMLRDLNVDNNSSVVIESGGVLIIEGDLSTDNKMTINAGGTLIVLGNFIHSGAANQGGFDGSSPSNVYILGDITDKNGNPISLPADTYPILDCNTGDAWDDYVNSGCNYGKELDLIDSPIYQEICGEGLSGGEISNQFGDCSINVSLQSVALPDIPFGIYNWYYTEDLTKKDSNGKPLDISTWSSIVVPSSRVLDVSTLFVRQAKNDQACVVYSNIITVSPSPSPIGIFFE